MIQERSRLRSLRYWGSNGSVHPPGSQRSRAGRGLSVVCGGKGAPSSTVGMGEELPRRSSGDRGIGESRSSRGTRVSGDQRTSGSPGTKSQQTSGPR
jgi:hypothetical protein